MNKIEFFAKSLDQAEAALALGGAYTILVIATPIMIALLLLIVFLMTIGVYGVQDRLVEIRKLLEDIFSEKLDALDREEDKLQQEEKVARALARANKLSSLRPATKNRRMVLWILVGSIPVLLIALIVIVVLVG